MVLTIILLALHHIFIILYSPPVTGYTHQPAVIPTSYLKDYGVTLYTSASTNNTDEGPEVLLLCNNKPINLLRVYFGVPVTTLHIRKCSLGNLTKQTALHLLTQNIINIYIQDSALEILSDVFLVYQQTLREFSLINSTLSGELKFLPMFKVSTLILSGLNLLTLPEGLSWQQTISSIDLSGNSLSELSSKSVDQSEVPAQFDWKSVDKLSLASNFFLEDFSLSTMLSITPRLKQLSLAHNSLASLSADKLTVNCSLIALDLSHNRVTSLEWLMKEQVKFYLSPNLKLLNLAHNQIAYLNSSHLSTLSSLLLLDLSFNNLKYLDRALHNVPLPSILKLQGNRWTCDCHMVWLHASNEFRKQSLPYCYVPGKLKDFLINDFPAPSECPVIHDVEKVQGVS